MAVLIGSLCFSVGEGLRLTPFPVSALSQVTEIHGLEPAAEVGGSAPAKYGPLDVPSPIQKRNKRQTADFTFPPAVRASQFVIFRQYYSTVQSIQLRSSLLVSRPAGRAPPLVS